MGGISPAGGGPAFGMLAKFLFGGNSDSRALEMTTPVITSSSGAMQFVLPLTQPADAPSPLPGAQVQVKSVRFVPSVILFSKSNVIFSGHYHPKNRFSCNTND